MGLAVAARRSRRAAMLEVIKADIDTALGLTGHTSVAALDRSALYRAAAPPVSPPVGPAAL